MSILKTLTQLPGIPGHESRVKAFIKDELNKENAEILEDNLGSLIAKKGTQGPKIMIAGHMDEIGLIISAITNEGFIKFQTVGGWFSQVMLAQLWDIHTDNGILIGVTGIKPPHLIPLDQRSKAIPMDDLFIDIGVASKEEALEKGIQIGQMITPHNDYYELANPHYHLAKAFDNRVGSYVVLEAFKRAEPKNAQLYATFTVQEEVGLRGAKTTSYIVEPDLAVSVDTGVGNDVPKGDKNEQTLGQGPQIYLFDRTTIGHPKLRRHLLNLAKKHDIPTQQPYIKQGGTDAGNMHLAHRGAPAVSLGIPTRYMHSHYSMIHTDDVEHAIKLLVAFINACDEDTLLEIKK
jgi:putative aminopeptidase FrvX